MEDSKKNELMVKMEQTDPATLSKEEIAQYAEQMSDWDQNKIDEFYERCPNWVEPLQKAGSEYYDLVKNMVESNNKNTGKVLDAHNKAITGNNNGLDHEYELAKETLENYKKELKRDDLSDEERHFLNEQQSIINDEMREDVAKAREADERLANEAAKVDFENKIINMVEVLGLGTIIVSLAKIGYKAYTGQDLKIDIKTPPKNK